MEHVNGAPRIKALKEDIRFTQYRLSFKLAAASALEVRLAGLERELEQAVDVERKQCGSGS